MLVASMQQDQLRLVTGFFTTESHLEWEMVIKMSAAGLAPSTAVLLLVYPPIKNKKTQKNSLQFSIYT